MSIHDRDYILRMIRQMVEMLARLVGLKGAPPEQALRTIDETAQTLFGPLYRTLRDADASTAKALVTDREKLWALSALLLEEAKINQAQGDPRAANRRLRTSALLLLDLAARPGGLTDPEKETFRSLAAHFDLDTLSKTSTN